MDLKDISSTKPTMIFSCSLLNWSNPFYLAKKQKLSKLQIYVRILYVMMWQKFKEMCFQSSFQLIYFFNIRLLYFWALLLALKWSTKDINPYNFWITPIIDQLLLYFSSKSLCFNYHVFEFSLQKKNFSLDWTVRISFYHFF